MTFEHIIGRALPRRSPTVVLVRVLSFVVLLAIGCTLGRFLAYRVNTNLDILALCFLAIAIFLIFEKPELGLLIFLPVVMGFFGVIRQWYLFHIKLPFGSLNISDIFFVFFWIAYIMKKQGSNEIGRENSLSNSPLKTAVLLMLFLTIYHFVNSMFFHSISLHRTLREVRMTIYYSLFFVFVGLIKDRAQLERITKGLVFLAFLASIVVFYQHIAQRPLDAAIIGEVEVGYTNIARVYSPAWGLILFASLFLLTKSILQKERLFLKVLLTSLLLITILLSFARSLWFTALMGIATVIFLSGKGRIKKLIGVAIVFLFLVVALGTFWRLFIPGRTIGYVSIVVDRVFSGVIDIRYTTGTWRQRIEVMQQRKIAENFLFGAGAYDGPERDQMNPLRNTGHNVYGDILLRYGLFGMFCFAFLWIAYFMRSVYVLKTVKDPFCRSIIIAGIALMLGAIFESLAASQYVSYVGTLVVVLMISATEIIYRINAQKRASL